MLTLLTSYSLLCPPQFSRTQAGLHSWVDCVAPPTPCLQGHPCSAAHRRPGNTVVSGVRPVTTVHLMMRSGLCALGEASS